MPVIDARRGEVFAPGPRVCKPEELDVAGTDARRRRRDPLPRAVRGARRDDPARRRSRAPTRSTAARRARRAVRRRRARRAALRPRAGREGRAHDCRRDRDPRARARPTSSAIEAIEQRAYPTPWSRSMFASELAKPTSICLGAFEGDRSSSATSINSRYVDAWHVMNVAVDPDHQRRGIATALLERLFELTRDDERRGYTLEVRVSNEDAIGLYEKLGFESRGIRRGYYTDNREDALIMWRDARPTRDPRDRDVVRRDRRRGRHARTARSVSSIVASQDELHARFGGVVPEVASRRHLELVAPVIEEALDGAARRSTTSSRRRHRRGPGLIGALLVGVSAAKALAWARRLPLMPGQPPARARRLALPAAARPRSRRSRACSRAAGTRCCSTCRTAAGYRVLGTTLDDAAGEAFDKGARLLGLGYPGGRRDRRARASRATRRRTTSRSPACPGSTSRSPASRPRCSTRCATSRRSELEARRADLAASYQRAIVRALVERIEAAGRGDADRRRRRRRRELRAARSAARRGARAARRSAPTTRR